MIHGHSWLKCIICTARGSHFFGYISVIRCFGAVWAWPDLCCCAGATLGVEVGVGTGVTFGIAVGVETGTAGFGSGVMGQLIVVFVEWLWQAVAQVWET